MDNTKQYRDQQEAKQLQNRISFFMKNFKVGTLLHSNGIRKLRVLILKNAAQKEALFLKIY